MLLKPARSRDLFLMAVGISLFLVAAAALAQPFTLTEYQVGGGLAGIASASDGSVWFVGGTQHTGWVNAGTGAVSYITIPASDGEATNAAIMTMPTSVPGVDDVWLGGNQHLLRVLSPGGGNLTLFPLHQTLLNGHPLFHSVGSIAWDGANTVWFTDDLLGIGQYSLWSLSPLDGSAPPSQITQLNGCVPTGEPIGDLTRGSDGNLWFVSSLQDVCRIVLPAGTIDSFPLPQRVSGLTSGPDGRIWGITYGGLQAFNPSACPGTANGGVLAPTCQVSVYTGFPTPGGTAREFNGITAGPDGRIWFTFDKDDEGVGTVKTDGTDFQYVILPLRPFPGNRPGTIVAGPPGDNSVWFTEPGSGYVGRIGGLASQTTELFLQGGRFKLDVTWSVPPQGTSGVGTAIPIAPDTGAFWFFSPNNLELMIKVLDGRAINGHWWVFYGALTNVEFDLTVTDLATGAVQTFHNPYGIQASVTDTTAFSLYAPPPQGARSTSHEVKSAASGFEPVDLVRAEFVSERAAAPQPAQATCTPDAQSLCLTASRFKVQVAWQVPDQGTSGNGTAFALTSDTGVFWFFSSDNLELILKVLDGRAINNHFWVFYGALSNVQYTITITDTETNTVKTYVNPFGKVASVNDTSAF